MKKRANILFLPVYYEHRIHVGIVRYAREANWILIRGTKQSGTNIDGIISFHAYDRDVQQLINSASCPVVDLNVPTEGINVPCVIHDNYQIGKIGAEYFINRGFKHLAYARRGTHPNTYDRMIGFKEAVKGHGRYFYEVNYHKLKEELPKLPKPLALMCPNDMLAVHAMRTCEDLSIEVPDEVALLGVDDDILQCELSPIPLSSINTDFEAIGYKAAELLHQMMQGHAAPKEPIKVAPLGVITRQSTDLTAIDDTRVVKALKLLQKQFKTQVNLDETAAESGMCRRRLEDAFRKHLGHSMRLELTRLRLKYAMDLLLNSELKLHAIAEESGFSSLEHMIRIFKREKGKSPSAIRKQHRVGK